MIAVNAKFERISRHMLIAVLSWIYIAFVCLTAGVGINKLLKKLIPTPQTWQLGITGYIVTGMVALTVYAEVFSVFYKVGAVCHILMLLFVACVAIFARKDILGVLSNLKDRLSDKKVILFALIVIAAAFYTSRGKYHTDTGIYHAQAIRILEEYGLLKGLGNIQLHFAYNSSYLVLCALFTMSFILPFALHTMTGFFMVLFSSYAVVGLFDFKEHRRHGGDFARIAILIYALTNMTGLQSPATDYGTMFMVLYILCAWISYAEENVEKRSAPIDDIAFYGYLSVLSIFTVSMKLSAALLVVLALLPFVMLVREKKWKELIMFLVIGFLSFVPYLVRNVIISGWLFYPVEAIDFFNVVWKIPAEYMKHDSDQIKVWGRCLFDVERVDEGISSWLPIWWEAKEHYDVMLIYSQFVGGLLLVINTVYRILKKKFNPAVCIFYVTVLVNILMWFVTAPFIRYELAFLLILPLCALGDTLDIAIEKKSVVLFAIASLIFINFCSWIDNYFMDDMVFAKHYATAGYYVAPIPFEHSEMAPIDMSKDGSGQIVYASGMIEVNSYYVCPGTCYEDMILRSELIGDTIEEGFKAK